MSEEDRKAFALSEKLCGWDGVESCEVYRKPVEAIIYDVLVKTSTGQLIEGTISNIDEMELMLKYVDIVNGLKDLNFRNYPNGASDGKPEHSN